MNKQVDLSIVILNYKMDGLVKNCLKSLYSHDCPLTKEIIVVDNGSEDEIESIITNQFPEVKFIQAGRNLGHAKGNNLGFKEATGRYVMVLNPDTVFLDNIFDQVVQYLDENKKIGISTVQLRNPDQTLQPGAWRFLQMHTPLVQRSSFFRNTQWGQKHAKEFEMHDWDRKTCKDVDWVQGSCMIVRREALDELKGFDEQFFLYFTDVDLCRRAWEAGWRVHYYSKASVIHYYHRESAQGSIIKSLRSKAARLHVKDFMKYLAKYRGNLTFERQV